MEVFVVSNPEPHPLKGPRYVWYVRRSEQILQSRIQSLYLPIPGREVPTNHHESWEFSGKPPPNTTQKNPGNSRPY